MNPRPESSPEAVVREIKRRTRRRYSAEEKIRIVLEGLKGEASIGGVVPESVTPAYVYFGRSNQNGRESNEGHYSGEES